MQFDLNYMAGYGLDKIVRDYYPLIISVNFADEGQQYCLLHFGVFEQDANKNITGIDIKQTHVIINGLPFEIKTIYGLEQDQDTTEGTEVMDGEEDEDDLCKICLFEQKDTLVMPCGHLCMCHDCGKMCLEKNPLCPICRGHMSHLLPIKRNK